jgi:3-phosphoshikimate 1-carboxyvinyltransferase
MREALELAGATLQETEDGMIIDGTGGAPCPAAMPARSSPPISTTASP